MDERKAKTKNKHGKYMNKQEKHKSELIGNCPSQASKFDPCATLRKTKPMFPPIQFGGGFSCFRCSFWRKAKCIAL
ncbi:hypothetical protein AVEN_264661-1, partial [Araneus ventricosus]